MVPVGALAQIKKLEPEVSNLVPQRIVTLLQVPDLVPLAQSLNPNRYVAHPHSALCFPPRRGAPSFVVRQRRSVPRHPASPYTTSTNVRSIRLNTYSPLASSNATIASDTSSTGPSTLPLPNNTQRNPSTTPAIGFSAYTTFHGAGIILCGYTTGV